jgi:hypothetical protein
MKDEWLTFLPCPFQTQKCGSKTQRMQVGKDIISITAQDMEQGDVCMYELLYSGVNKEYKIWVDSIYRAEITLIDGIRTHPWVD